MYYKGSNYSVLTTHQHLAAAGQTQGARGRDIVGEDGGGRDGDGVEGDPGQDCLVSCYVTSFYFSPPAKLLSLRLDNDFPIF